MGGGKTSSVLMALDELSLVEDVYPALIVAPKRVAKNTWPGEIKEWREFSHLTISPIIGTEAERRSAMRVKSQFFTVNYENLPWLVNELGNDWPYKSLIIDESSKCRGFRLRQGTKRSHALASRAFLSNRLVELSGTPAPGGLSNLWGEMYFLDRGERLGRSFNAFKQRWFRPTWDGYGIEALPHAQREIENKIKDVCVSIDLSQYFKIEKPIENKIWVELPEEAKKLYKNMEKHFFLEIENCNVEAFNSAAKSTNLLEICNGAIYTSTETKEWKEIHKVKLEALESIIEEAEGAPVLVVYNFRSDLARLKDYFPSGRYFDDKKSTEDDWNAGEIPIMWIHAASGGHGVSLHHGGNIIVFFGLGWDLELFQQVRERIGVVRQMQSGYKRNVFEHYILVKDSIEELVLERLTTKRKVQDILMDALKARKL